MKLVELITWENIQNQCKGVGCKAQGLLLRKKNFQLKDTKEGKGEERKSGRKRENEEGHWGRGKGSSKVEGKASLKAAKFEQ